MMPYDIAVLGGGPAGMAAATEAASRGARIVLLEEIAAARRPGLSRAPAGFAASRRMRIAASATRCAPRWLASGAELRTGCRVWGLGGGPLVPQGSDAVPFTLSTRSARTACPSTVDGARPGAVHRHA